MPIITTTRSRTRTTRTRLITLIATAASAAAIIVVPAGSAAGSVATSQSATDCQQLLQYLTNTPAYAKPRGNQDAPDGRDLFGGCF